jgi:hypothetical protein
MIPRLTNVGSELMEPLPEELCVLIKVDYDKWLKIIKDADTYGRLEQ